MIFFKANSLWNWVFRQRGFEIGPTTNACTKGIWIWNRPLRLSENQVAILLDTEGLGSLERNQNIDMKLFSLAILISSAFIYNK
jgi:hypothetical protein